MDAQRCADVVERQLQAYNRQDLEDFLGCYSDGVVFFDFPNTLRFEGKDAARARYGRLFAANPRLRARTDTRIVRPPLVIDHEVIDGHEQRADGVNGVVIYRVDDGLITKVWSGAWSDEKLKGHG